MNPIAAIFGRRKAQRAEIADLKSQVQKLSAQSDHSGGGYWSGYHGQKWPGGLSSPSPVLNIDSYSGRQQVRALSHTSTQTSALINRDIDNVVDSGLMIDAEPQSDMLGLTPEEGQAWAADINTRFDLWAQNKKSSSNGKMNFYQAQRLMQRYLSRDGECFVQHLYSSDPKLPNPLRFNIVDPDQIGDMGTTSTSGYMRSLSTPLDGIEFDEFGEESAYKVFSTDPKTGIQTTKRIPRIGPSGRTMMTHGMNIEYQGQNRGIPPLLVSAQDLQCILDLALAEIEKSKNQANVAFTLKNNSDEPGDDPFPPGTYRAGAIKTTPAAEQFGNNPKPAPGAQNVTDESLQPVYSEIPNTEFRRPGSTGVFSVGPHQELVPFGNTAPAAQFDAFVSSYFSFIAASNGQSIETVLLKFGQNYSASRATLILTWRIACQRRFNLAAFHLDDLYESWLSEEIAAGRILAPGWSDPVLRLAWLRHRWNGVQMPQMDPTKEAKAAELYRNLGATTGEEISLNHNGSSFKSNVAKLAKEMPALNAAMGNIAPDLGSKEDEDDDESK